MLQLNEDDSLLEIVEKLVAVDAGTAEISPDDHAKLGELLHSKVDRVVYFIKEIESRIERHKSYESDHKEARKHLEKSLDKFKDYITHTMKVGSFQKLTGDEFHIGTRKSEEIVIERDPTPTDAEMFPELVRSKITYEWNKSILKDWLKNGNLIDGIAHVRVNQNLTTGVKK